jgi:DNA integrity scanning protein DisA with diadenylate cyclase activity
MNLFTSSFARAGRLPDAVSISRGKPRWYDGRSFDLLAPSWEWIKNYQQGIWTWEKYVASYDLMLSELDAANVVAALGENAVMCCFCKPQERCHRFLVADFIERETGLIVPELGTEAGQMSFDFAELKSCEEPKGTK